LHGVLGRALRQRIPHTPDPGRSFWPYATKFLKNYYFSYIKGNEYRYFFNLPYDNIAASEAEILKFLLLSSETELSAHFL
jgi:hypothetical protein